MKPVTLKERQYFAFLVRLGVPIQFRYDNEMKWRDWNESPEENHTVAEFLLSKARFKEMHVYYIRRKPQDT